MTGGERIDDDRLNAIRERLALTTDGLTVELPSSGHAIDDMLDDIAYLLERVEQLEASERRLREALEAVVNCGGCGRPAHAADAQCWWQDMSVCPYFARWHGLPGFDPEATCAFGCRDEPECVTCDPGGWPLAMARAVLADVSEANAPEGCPQPRDARVDHPKGT